MASDTKRQSVGGRVPVALPKAENSQPAASLVSLDGSLQQAVGSRVKVTTIAPSQESVEGTLYTADPLTNLVVLHTGPTQESAITSASLAAPAGGYRIIPVSQISSFQLLTLSEQPGDATPSPSANSIDTKAVQARLAKNLAAQQKAIANQGPKGTTRTDQALFDKLSRTHPARWHGNTMIINDAFAIEKPYGQANIRLLDGAAGNLDWMKKVIDMERNKINLRHSQTMIDDKMGGANSPAKASSIPGGVKKGG